MSALVGVIILKVGIPQGLLYYKYHSFLENYFSELGAEIIVSPDTNKQILNDGVSNCIDEACLPIKVFHGHVMSIKDKCDLLIVPRVMRLKDKEFICPKFCGLPEMVINCIPNLPYITKEPIYATSKKELYKWAQSIGSFITKDSDKLKQAFNKVYSEYNSNKNCELRNIVNNKKYKMNIALVGHQYNVYDKFVNMNLVSKLNKLNVGVLTEECVEEKNINSEIITLFKKPFWTFARVIYGSSLYLQKNKLIDGIIYISSFACGVDSVVIELIKEQMGDFPMLILKVDEQTGEAGFDTRIEAFVDMLERRCNFESNISSLR